MPKLLDTTELRMEWADANNRVHHPFPQSHHRSPGVHLSGVLRYIAQESGILAKPGVDSTRSGKLIQDIDEDEMPLRVIFGMFFEEGAVGLYPDMHWQPGEFQRDKVFGTPDGITTGYEHGDIDIPLLAEEFKLTWKSEWNYGKDKLLTANWLWMHQGMGYCKLLQAVYCSDIRWVRYHIGWVNGDYRPPQPKYMRYLVEFSQVEIDAAWGLVLRNRDKKGVKRER